MYIRSKKIKLMMIVIVLLIVCTIIGVLKHNESIFATRTIEDRIDIGGYKLNVKCYGTGKPTIIFESGLGGPIGDWAKIQPEISKITRTFSYDRAGLGYSDVSKLQRTSLDQVHELHTLLNKAKVKGPYIIVAHSIGGYNARLFAATYPKEMSGIVFIDCSDENQFDRMNGQQLEKAKEQLAISELNLDELILSANQVKEIRKSDTIRNLQIVVLTADEKGQLSKESYNKFVIVQNDIASLSNYSKHIFVKDSGHYIQIDKPQVVIDAIKELIE